MELKTKAVYVAALLACSLIASSEAITCYECNIFGDSGCPQPFESYGTKTCSTGNACGKIKFSSGGISVETRGCLDHFPPTNECKEGSLFGVKGFFCICTRNRCNNAKSVIPSALLLAVVAVLSMSAAILK